MLIFLSDITLRVLPVLSFQLPSLHVRSLLFKINICYTCLFAARYLFSNAVTDLRDLKPIYGKLDLWAKLFWIIIGDNDCGEEGQNVRQ